MNGWKRRKSKMLVYLLNNFYKLNRHRRELDTMPSSAQSWSSPPWIGPSPKPAAHTASPGARRRTSSAVPPSSPAPTPRSVSLSQPTMRMAQIIAPSPFCATLPLRTGTPESLWPCPESFDPFLANRKHVEGDTCRKEGSGRL